MSYVNRKRGKVQGLRQKGPLPGTKNNIPKIPSPSKKGGPPFSSEGPPVFTKIFPPSKEKKP